MAQYLTVHPRSPQPRLIRRAADVVHSGGVIVYPTDSCYALGCRIGDKEAAQRIRQIRELPEDRHLTLVCASLAQVAQYARLDDFRFRSIKRITPGSYVFILPATKEVPRRLQHPRRKTIGLRIPEHAIAQALLAELGEPLMSVTLMLPGDEHPLSDPEEIRVRLEHAVDLVIDGGNCGWEPTTVVDLAEGTPRIARTGKGESAPFIAGA